MKPLVPTWLVLALLGGALGSPAQAEPSRPTASQIIAHFKMQKIPEEGPWFALTYRGDDALKRDDLPARYAGQPHVLGSSIVALETKADFSALHRLATDELWHFYGGDPLELLLLYPDGHGEIKTLGPDILSGQVPQLLVPKGVWQGSRPIGSSRETYTFFGNTLSPGFEYGDFEIGYRDELQKAYPKDANRIAELTREEFAHRTTPAKPPLAAAAPGLRAGVLRPEEVGEMTVHPGLLLRELTGRRARQKTDDCSIAQFSLAPGATTGASYNKVSDEFFLIAQGQGEAVLAGKTSPARAGELVVIPAGVTHALRNTGKEPLKFYAISTPAYQPANYVPVK